MQVFGYGRMGEVVKNLRSVAVAGYQSYWFFTQWTYDSWNRIKTITYPDQEVVTYNYNTGGALQSIGSIIPGINSVQNVVNSITYDNYGDRSSITYGNNAVTNYTYDVRRRMSSLSHHFASNYVITKNYGYDVLSNIKTISTDTPQNSLPAAGAIGGPISHTYTYDIYNRLTTAQGSYTGPNDFTTPYLRQQYTLAMEYNLDNTIKTKTQHHWQGEVANSTVNLLEGDGRPVKKTSYTLNYDGYATGAYALDMPATNAGSSHSYGYQQPHAVRTLTETPSYLSPGTDDPRIKHTKMLYDANGNLTETKDLVGGVEITTRKNLWDEENRLKAVNLKPDDPTGHPIAIYTYDAGGERTVRYNYDRIDIASNATEPATNENVKDNVMVYPSGLMMGKATHLSKLNTLAYTNHYYIGSERVSAKTATLSVFGDYPNILLGQKMPNLTEAITRTPSNTAVSDAYTTVSAIHNSFNVTPPPNTALQPSESIITYTDHDGTKLSIFYFHPDHLGSSSYITNKAGIVSQHMEYLAFGETLVDEHLNSNNSPFKYNGKELDEETGNYYYGGRYYDPKLSTFIGVDSMANKNAGLSPYAYCFNSPIIFIDPDGNDPTPYEAALMASHVYGTEVTLVGGWQVSALDYYNTNNPETGLKAAMYERIKEDGVMEYAYVFAGTEGFFNPDAANDVSQAVGSSKQYSDAANSSQKMSKYIGGQELTFVGHSLGGGLAILSSLVTGRSSITFNPAWVSYLTAKKYTFKALKEDGYRRNFVHESDPLNRLQLMFGWASGLTDYGKTYKIEGGFWSNPVTGHLIGTMIERLEANNQNTAHKGNRDDTIIHASPRTF